MSPWVGIIFDMDGVLFDTEPIHMRAWQAVLAEAELQYDDAFFRQWVGIPDEDLGAFLEDTHAPEGPWGFLNRKRTAFQELVHAELTPPAGLPEALARLAAHLPLAVATSSQRHDLELMTRLAGLSHLFGATCAHGDVSHHKPHPEPYRTAAARLGVRPDGCAALDDSPSGVASAKAAGMLTLGIATTFPPAELAAADRVFDTTVEACHWLLAQIEEE